MTNQDADTNVQEGRPAKLVKLVPKMIGGVVLAVIGEALWETVFKPSVPAVLSWIVGISTFGIQSVQDNINVDITVGSYERAALAGYVLFLSMLSTMVPAVYTGFFLSSTILPLKPRGPGEQKGTSVEFKRQIRRRIVFFVIPSSIFILLFGLFQISIISYEARADGYLRQMLRIDRPYIEEKTYAKLESACALIKNKSDFINVERTLRKIGEENQLSMSKFHVFD